MQKSGLNPFMQKRFLSDVLTKSQTGSMSDLILVWCSQSGFGEILDGGRWAMLQSLQIKISKRCGAKRSRTADLCSAIAALYQLSYSPLMRSFACAQDDKTRYESHRKKRSRIADLCSANRHVRLERVLQAWLSSCNDLRSRLQRSTN